jgi:uncharacterized membrane protein (DUF2068 family)
VLQSLDVRSPPPFRPPPAALDERTSTVGLRAVAVFEAAKGLIVLLLGLGLLALLHKDVESTAEGLLLHLHINPDRRLSHAFLDAASRVTDARLWGMAAAAVAYTSVRFTEGVRFTEAWGLWHKRVWAEWFALLSGALYLPWEIVKLVEHPNGIHATVFVGNLVIVAYMAYIRCKACRIVAQEVMREPSTDAVVG